MSLTENNKQVESKKKLKKQFFKISLKKIKKNYSCKLAFNNKKCILEREGYEHANNKKILKCSRSF